MTSILPPNSTTLDRAVEAAVQVVPTPRIIRDLFNADTCPIELLPYLAWEFGVRTWSNEWPEPVRRERVRRAIDIQRQKGTMGALRRVVSVFGGNISIREWWQKVPRGKPHTFDLVLTLNEVTGGAPSSEYIEQVLDEVRQAKPERSQFTFTQGVATSGGIGTKAVARAMTLVRLSATAPPA